MADPRRLLQERRTQTRFPCRLHAKCWTGAGRTGVSWPGSIHDVSERGIGITLARAFSAGTILTLEFELEKPGLTRRVRVVHARPVAGGWLHGCQFLERLEPQQLEQLSK